MEIDDRARRCQELFSQAIRLRQAGDESAARAKYLEVAPLYDAQARDQLQAGNPNGWINLYAAITCAGEAHYFTSAAALISLGRDLAESLSKGRQNVERQLDELDGWLASLQRGTRENHTADRVGRYIASCKLLSVTFDHIRRSLMAKTRTGLDFAGPLIKEILDSTRYSLQQFTGDPGLSINLFSCKGSEVDERAFVLPATRTEARWRELAFDFVDTNEDTLWQGTETVGLIDDLVQRGALAEHCRAVAGEARVVELAAYPVRAFRDRQAEEAFVMLVALAGKSGVFDDLACHLLAQTVELMQLVVQIGRRDELFSLSEPLPEANG